MTPEEAFILIERLADAMLDCPPEPVLERAQLLHRMDQISEWAKEGLTALHPPTYRPVPTEVEPEWQEHGIFPKDPPEVKLLRYRVGFIHDQRVMTEAEQDALVLVEFQDDQPIPIPRTGCIVRLARLTPAGREDLGFWEVTGAEHEYLMSGWGPRLPISTCAFVFVRKIPQPEEPLPWHI